MEKQQVIYQIQQALQLREVDANGVMSGYTLKSTDRALLAKALADLLLAEAAKPTPTPAPAVA